MKGKAFLVELSVQMIQKYQKSADLSNYIGKPGTCMRQRSILQTRERFSFCPNGDLKPQNYHFLDIYLLLSHCPYAGRNILHTGKGVQGHHG